MKIDENHLTYKYVMTAQERREYRELNPLPKRPLLPPPTAQDANKILLVLDLDQTLMNSHYTTPSHYDFSFKLYLPANRKVKEVYVQTRPHCEAFLKGAYKWFEMAIYTASIPIYADQILNTIDPHRLIKHRLYRHHCGIYKDHYVKDLEFLGRPLNRVVLVDNHPASYMAHYDNGIPIYSYLGQPDDTGLKDLLSFLLLIRDTDDVIPCVQKYGIWWRRKLHDYLTACAEREGTLQRAALDDGW
ncbi:phosphatase PSR1-like [Tropilaelaps mercedesae]|uniref:Phosphatase PSR1-like n=1 Tax=Tropilaelaps mercedesae TaxID=418985 RepID=A0A1V9Y2K3_9ACAR|nr:phosphatase PSR1-like [Tropilaelaps mercedesae]